MAGPMTAASGLNSPTGRGSKSEDEDEASEGE